MWFQGGDLNQKIKQRSEAGKTFSESLILDWFIQLSTALKYIHERLVIKTNIAYHLITSPPPLSFTSTQAYTTQRSKN